MEIKANRCTSNFAPVLFEIVRLLESFETMSYGNAVDLIKVFFLMAHEQRLLFGGRSFLAVVRCGNQEFLIDVEYLKNWGTSST